MNCPCCNSPLTEKEIVCPACKARVAQLAQEAKVHKLSHETGVSCLKGLRERIFLIYSVFLSVITIFAVADVVTGFLHFDLSEIINIAVSLALAAFTVVSAIAAWKIYILRNGDVDSKNVRMLTIYPKLQIIINIAKSVMYGVSMIPLGIVLLFARSYVSGDADRMQYVETMLELLGAEEMFGTTEGLIHSYTHVLGFDLITISLLAIAVCMARVVMMRRLGKYITMLANVADGDEFKRYTRLPTLLLWAFGTVAFVSGILEALTDPIGALLNLSTAGYLVVSAIMFKRIADEMDYAIRKLEDEKKALMNITEATDKLLEESSN